MWVATTFFSAVAFAAGVSAQTGEFEAPDFNITEALIANGINVSAIPELAPLAERSLFSGCSIAVSRKLHEMSNQTIV
jgi:hypothetical protein